MPKPPFGTQQWRGFLARWSVIALALCVTDLILSALTTDGPLRLAMAPVTMRWSLVAQECALLSLLAILPALPARRGLRVVAAGVLALMFTTGWLTFRTVGRFPGADAVGFFLTVPTQAVQHAVQLQAAIIPATVLAMLLMVGAIDRLAVVGTRAGAGVSGLILGGVALLVSGTSAGFAVIHSRAFARSTRDIYERSTGVNYRTDRLWTTLKSGNAGAASGMLLSLWSGVQLEHVIPRPDPSIRVDHPSRAPGELVVQAAPAHRWNVLIVEVESMRADVLTRWGGPLRVMPTVEDIAADSRRYLDTYTTATQTDLAAVVPLSGQYPLRDLTLRAYPEKIAYPKVMLYDLLAPDGWRAGVFSSQNEDWWGMVNFLRSPSLDTLLHAENYTGNTYVPRNDLGFSRFVRNAKRAGKIDDRETVGAALQWLQAAQDKPFFLYVNLQTSHLPYTVPSDAPRRFGKGPPSFPILFGRYPADSAEVVRNEYRNALAYVDDQIARLRSALIADGRWDSTIVVITGDHGQGFFEHPMIAGHANGIFQELVKIPLVIRAPGLAHDDDSRPASNLDIAPTIASLLGLPAQPAWQGISLVGEAPPANRPRFFMVQSPLSHRVGVVSGRWKMWRDIREGQTRLIDIDADPLGNVDLTNRYPDVARRMLALLDTWRSVQLTYYASTFAPTVSFPPRIVGGMDPDGRMLVRSNRK